MKKLKKIFINKHAFTILIISSIILILGIYFYPSIFRLKDSFLNIIKAFNDNFVFTSIEYNTFKFNTTIPSINISKDSFKQYFDNLFSLNCFGAYLQIILINSLEIILLLCHLFLFFIPLKMVFKSFVSFIIENENNDYNEDTKTLKIYKKTIERPLYKIKNKLIDYLNFLKSHKYYFNILILLLIVLFNFLTILFNLMAFYIRMLVQFNFNSGYLFLSNIIIDLTPFFKYFNYWLIIPLIALLLYLRYKLACTIRKYFHNKNMNYISNTNIVNFYTGTMGSQKTKTITDIALNSNIIFRDKALELLNSNMNKFQNFPFIEFEIEIKELINDRIIYNLATCKKYIDKKRIEFENNKIKENIYNYDFEKYGLYYNDKLINQYIFDMLKNYIQEYFIYVMQTSLIVSNYSIREDLKIVDKGNFPKVDSDLFNRNILTRNEDSKFSHIVDFDFLRLGKKIQKDNYRANAFEFGILNLTEIGKERGNKFDTAGQKKTDDFTNQTNDLFNNWLKLCRHTATIENYPFIKVMLDDQRAMSLGADVRDLCEVININKVDKNCCCMPFYFEKALFHRTYDNINKLLLELRFYRGDNTLLGYLLKSLNAKIYRHILNVENNFNYIKVFFNKYDVINDSYNLTEQVKYYLLVKSIHAERYATDCYSDYFAPLKLSSLIGINDIDSYKSVYATTEELHEQNSYLIKELEKLSKGIKED